MDEVWRHTCTYSESTCTVLLFGELNVSNYADILRTLLRELERPGNLAVQADLGGVEFLDSSGMRALLIAHNAAEGTDRSFVAIRARGAVRRALEMAGVLEVLSGEDLSPPRPGS